MEYIFQILDCDYTMVDGLPVIRIFGKTKDNKTICAFYKKFLPYFYLLHHPGSEQDVVNFLKKSFPQILANITRDEKYTPIGFQTKKTEMLKITLKDPSKVSEVRDTLKRQPFTKEIFEADILFKYRFMTDHNIAGMRWIKVSGVGEKTSTVKTKQFITIEKMENADEEIGNSELKHMGFDIEVISGKEGLPDSKNDPIAMISLAFFPNFNQQENLVLVSKPIKNHNGNTISFTNETKMLEHFIKIIDTYDPDVLVGYNSNNFDIPYIVDRLRECKLSAAIGRCTNKPMMSRKFGITVKNVIVGRVITDVYDLIKESSSKGFLKLKRYGLGDVSKELLNEDKIDIAHSEIYTHWNGDTPQMDKLIEYSRKDAELVLKLLLKKDMLSKFIEISKISGVLLQDVLDGGEAVRVENIMLKEFNKQGYVIPLKPADEVMFKRMDEREASGLKGALVLDPIIGLHTNSIVYLDFKSMYPSIFISYNICPTTLLLQESTAPDEKEITTTPYGSKFVSKNIKPGIMPSIVKYLIAERDKVKKLMKSTADEEKIKVLDARQYALKVMANAFYGYTGYTRARFYVLDIANSITSCGRSLIQRTKDIVENNTDFKVVYGDTDSIMVDVKTKDLDEAFKRGGEIESRINTELSGIVSMKIESVFKTILVMAKKRYAGLSYEKKNGNWEEKIVMKGIETVRRDWCDLVSETLYRTLEIILKDQNPKAAINYIKEILLKLEKNEIAIEKLVVTKSISKPLKQYKGIQPHVELVKKMRKRDPSSTPGVGDRVGFVIIKGLQLMSDRAESPEYIKQNNLKIDSKYYVESQIIPPLERVFEAMGIDKTELISTGKQILLTDIIKNSAARSKGRQESVLNVIDGFICDRCNKTFRRIPLVGKCVTCGGEILFYSGEEKARYYCA